MSQIATGPLRLTLGAVLGVGAALLVACGASSSQLIPAGNAGPLQSDFDAIASSVKGGDCVATKQGVQQAQQDLAALPGTVNPRLLATLTTGVRTLAARAGTECKQNAAASTTTVPTQTQTQTSTNTSSTPTNTNTTNTNTQPTDTNTQPTNTSTSPSTTPATTVPDSTGGPPTGVGGAQAPGQTLTSSSGASGGTPGGGN